MSHHGSCFCGAVSYAVWGAPTLSAYCHCTNCQRLTGCPFVHTIHFPKDAFSWTHAAKGGTSSADEALSEGPAPPLSEAQLESFVIPSKPWKTRFRCRSCGACVMSTNAKTGSCSVWGAHLARDADGRILGWDGVQPTAHIFYGTRMLDVADGLGKWEGYEARSARVD